MAEVKIYVTRNIKMDSDFVGELLTENKKANASRKLSNQKIINSSEELIELAKEGLAERKRVRALNN